MLSYESPKVQAQHREREAYVYIRQSSPGQVEHNLESQDLQYQLARQAQTMGWREDQIVIIDDDLGKSGASSEERSGFQKLVAEIGLHHVGIILVTDVSRLARNCADWYQLLDLASMCGTLISDASGIYEPRNFDDRLLLGMKGTFAEAQWFTMRSQLHMAKLNKAKRGELVFRLAVGYEYLPKGGITMTPDQDVQSALKLIFVQFEQHSSARGVLRYFRQHRLKIPRTHGAGALREIVWVAPSYQAIYHVLKQPAYAGVYTYGKQHTERLPGASRKVVHRHVPLEEWPVLIQNAFPGYISWDQYMHNQDKLRANRQNANWAPGAPRAGQALLAGLVTCARCGRPMHVHYTHSPGYVCDLANRTHDEPRCQRFTIEHVDAAISAVFLQAIQPACIEAALAAVTHIEVQQQTLATHWKQRIERAQYEADLARRRYEKVDPDLRLVAAELERLWEDKLKAWHTLQREWAHLQSTQCAPLSANDLVRIRQLAQDVPALWQADSTTPDERKRLLRCLIQDVTLDSLTQPGFSLIHVRWCTGTITTLTVARPKSGGPPAPNALKERIETLAQTHPDDQIADILNTEGTAMARHTGAWTMLRVRHFRNKHQIASGCPYVAKAAQAALPRGDGLISANEAARRLNTSFSMIADWFRRGLITGHQREPGTPLWVRLDDEDRHQLDGSATQQPDMVPIALALPKLNLTPPALRTALMAGQLRSYRLAYGNGWRWFFAAPPDSPFLNLLSLSGVL